MTILPLAYLGSVEWFAWLMRGDCVIDTGENWVKQTSRNRCEIMTSGGTATLTVPVHGGNGSKNAAPPYSTSGSGSSAGNNLDRNLDKKIPTKDIRIDNSKRWQHTHWTTLVSAYRNSPYFDHYEEKFAPLYSKKLNYLTEINLELLNILTSILKPDVSPQISEYYVTASPGDVDLRGKKAFRRLNDSISNSSSQTIFGYTQVFSDRFPFTPGLSIVDLLFCEGPAAREFLSATP